TAMMLPLVTAASAPDLVAENLAWLQGAAPSAPAQDLRAGAAFAASRGVSFADLAGDAPRLAGPALPVHYGEGWHSCYWAEDSSAPPCDLASGVGTGAPCIEFPAHWALFVFTPAFLQVSNGVGGDARVDIYWTETHVPLGNTPYVQLGGPPVTSTGSGCIVANSPSFVLTTFDGVHLEQ
ncbi:MAG TPA: hypothetical protein VGR28_06550, partial [Candidatus Thermoplasmatota archaeon]|nr:hypothetical protein [Candidatus Thermoplasmatota archaeon]